MRKNMQKSKEKSPNTKTAKPSKGSKNQSNAGTCRGMGCATKGGKYGKDG